MSLIEFDRVLERQRSADHILINAMLLHLKGSSKQPEHKHNNAVSFPNSCGGPQVRHADVVWLRLQSSHRVCEAGLPTAHEQVETSRKC
jgi:hypothetical protein